MSDSTVDTDSGTTTNADATTNADPGSDIEVTVDPEPKRIKAPRRGAVTAQTVAGAPVYEYADPDYLPPEGASDKDWVHIPRRYGRLRRWSITGVVVLLCVGLVVGGAYLFGRSRLYPGDVDTDAYLAAVEAQGNDDPVTLPDVEVIEFVIADGDTLTDVSGQLESDGVITWGPAWRIWAQRQGLDGVEAGLYYMPKSADADLVLAILEQGPAVAEFASFLVPEGKELLQVTAEIGEQVEWVTAEELNAALFGGEVPSPFLVASNDSYEGLLFPAKYDIEEDEPADQILARMAAQMEAEVTKLNFDAKIADFSYLDDPYELIVLASLIEKEARTKGDKAKISRVIHNRLADDMKLDIDATFLYTACGSGWQPGDPVLGEWRELDCAHNTYVNKGLPPTPIAAPGADALEAAANPSTDPELANARYYVLCDINKNHCFSDTNEEHNQKVAEARAGGFLD